MKVWLSQHTRTFASTLGKIARSPMASLLNVGVIGVALALPVGFYITLAHLQHLAHQFAAAPQLSLYLTLDASASDAGGIAKRLEDHRSVRKYRYIPREEALRSMQASNGLDDLAQSLPDNPLPDAFVVDVVDGTGARALEALREEFRGWPKVAQVQVDSRWAERLEALLKVGRLGVLLLAGLLAFALVAVTFNTIRLQVLTQRQEIEVAKLIGATHPFIRRPFLYFGTLLGLAGGVAAWGIVRTALYLMNDGLAELSHLYGMVFMLPPPPMADVVSLLGFSAGLGWLGAWLSVNRHLSELDAR